MLTRLPLFVLTLLTGTVRAHPQERVDGWSADLDHWLGAVEREHFLLRGKELPEPLFARADWLREHLPELSDQRVLLELQRLAAFAGDGHTYLLPFATRFETTALPLRFHFFADGLFVIDAGPGFERWIGSQVLAFGKTGTDDVVARLADYVSRDNVHGIRWIGPTFLRLTGTLEAVAEGVAPARVPLTLRMPGGEPAEVVFSPARAEPSGGIPKLFPSRLPGAPPPPLDRQPRVQLEPVRLDARSVGAACALGAARSARRGSGQSLSRRSRRPPKTSAASAGRPGAVVAPPDRRRALHCPRVLASSQRRPRAKETKS